MSKNKEFIGCFLSGNLRTEIKAEADLNFRGNMTACIETLIVEALQRRGKSNIFLARGANTVKRVKVLVRGANTGK